MRRFLWLLVASFAVSLVAAQQHRSSSVSSPCFQVGKPIIHQNLAVFPVRLIGDIPEGDYLTLKEAQKEGLVVISELPEGASVPYVLVENKADKPLLLLGGEIILGGKQDRIVEHDTIIPPKTKMKVKVYCVEPGRWTPSEHGEKFFAPMLVVAPEVRKEAQVAKSQQRVWAENEAVQFHAFERAYGNQPIPSAPSQSYRRVLTDVKVKEETQAYVQAIQTRLLKDPKACGIIVAVNGKLEWLDVFGSPRLFRKAMPALMHSAAVQAVAKRGQDKQKRIPSVEQAQRFLTEAQRGRRKVELETAQQLLEKTEGKSVVGFALKDKRAPAEAPTVPAHINAYSK